MTTHCNILLEICIAIFAGIVLMIAGSIFLYILACVLYFWGDKVKTCEHCRYYDDGRNHCRYRNGDPDAEQTVFDYTEACEHFEDEKKTCRWCKHLDGGYDHCWQDNTGSKTVTENDKACENFEEW